MLRFVVTWVRVLLLLTLSLAPLSAQGEPTSPLSPEETPSGASHYRIGPQDVLSIEVFGLAEIDRRVRVLGDGSVSLPLLGSFQVAGMSPQAVQQRVAQMLIDRELVNDPQVSVFVEEYKSSTVSLQGAVQKPGLYPLIGPRTLLEILSEAGGTLGGQANRAGAEIIILRRDTAGALRRIRLSAELLLEGDPASNIYLEAGDVVLLPHAQRHRIYVTGAVRSPGPVEFSSSEGITVLQAVSAAGGPNERANQNKVHIVRRLADGSQERINVDLKKIRKGRAPDVVLENNDTVVVGEWFF